MNTKSSSMNTKSSGMNTKSSPPSKSETGKNTDTTVSKSIAMVIQIFLFSEIM